MEKDIDYEISIGDSFTLGGTKYEVKIAKDTLSADTVPIEDPTQIVTTYDSKQEPDKDSVDNLGSEIDSSNDISIKSSAGSDDKGSSGSIGSQVSDAPIINRDESLSNLLSSSASIDIMGIDSIHSSPEPSKDTLTLHGNHLQGAELNQKDENVSESTKTLNEETPIKTENDQITEDLEQQQDFIPSAPLTPEKDDSENNLEPRRSKRKKRSIDYSELDEGIDDYFIKRSQEAKVRSPFKLDVEDIFRHFVKSKFSEDNKTLVIYHMACTEHKVPDWHLERPERLQTIIDAISTINTKYEQYMTVNYGLFEKCELEYIFKCHEKKYLDNIISKLPKEKEAPPLHATMSFSTQSDLSGLLTRKDSSFQDTFVSFGSWDAALYASGSVCRAIDEVMDSNNGIVNAFCAVRPPGHHAGRKGHARAMTQGYCIINNVAIGCHYILDKYKLNRVAVFDFDVHQGNGTQEILESDPRVLFISMHGRTIYPFSGEEDNDPSNFCTDNVINIGYDHSISRKDYMNLFRERVISALEKFEPECIFLSAGFDAHQKDPTKACRLNILDYIAITRGIKKVAKTYSNGRVISVLEGGYDLDALKKSVTAHICALMESE